MNDIIKNFSTKKKCVQKLKARLCFLRSKDQLDKFLKPFRNKSFITYFIKNSQRAILIIFSLGNNGLCKLQIYKVKSFRKICQSALVKFEIFIAFSVRNCISKTLDFIHRNLFIGVCSFRYFEPLNRLKVMSYQKQKNVNMFLGFLGITAKL